MPPGLDWRAQCAVQDIIAWVRGNFQKLLSKGGGLYVFTDTQLLRFYWHSLFGRPSGDIFFVLAFLLAALLDRRPPGAQSFCFSFLPAAFGNWRPPGAPSFVARRKIGEKGVPKGSKAALWNLAFIRGFGGETCGLFYEFARVQLTRFRPARGVCKHTASTDSIVLHVMQRNCWNLKNNQPDL